MFRWIAEVGGISPAEMARTFNCGIGMAVFVARGQDSAVRNLFAELGEDLVPLGKVVAGQQEPALIRRDLLL